MRIEGVPAGMSIQDGVKLESACALRPGSQDSKGLQEHLHKAIR